MDPGVAAYLTFTFVLVVTPGSTTAVVVRNTLMGGRAAGFAAAAGAALGNATHATAAGLGLAVLFARWPAAFTFLRVAGGVFLAWLGARSLWRAVHGGATTDSMPGDRPRSELGGFRQGLAVNLLNPSIATFYLVVVPSFVPAAAPAYRFAAMAAAHVVMAFGCHSVWVLALDRLRALFQTAGARAALDGVTGLALLALAVRVLLS